MFECFAHNMVRVKLSLCMMHLRGGERLYRKCDIPFSGTPLQYGPVQRVFAWLRTLKKILQTQMWMMARWWIMEFWGATADSLLQFGRVSIYGREKTALNTKAPDVSVSRFHTASAESITEPLSRVFFTTEGQIKTGVESTLFYLRNWETKDVRTILCKRCLVSWCCLMLKQTKTSEGDLENRCLGVLPSETWCDSFVVWKQSDNIVSATHTTTLKLVTK